MGDGVNKIENKLAGSLGVDYRPSILFGCSLPPFAADIRKRIARFSRSVPPLFLLCMCAAVLRLQCGCLFLSLWDWNPSAPLQKKWNGFLKILRPVADFDAPFQIARRAENLPSPATGLPGFEEGGGIIFSARREYSKGEIRKYRKRCRDWICRVRGKFAAFCPSINGMRLLWGPCRIRYVPYGAGEKA